MEIEQVAELARTVAALPQSEKDYFDGLVADERAKVADAARIAELREMWDFVVVKKVLWECTDRPQRVDGDAALKMLREAGFVRTGGITLEQAYRAGFSTSAEGWNYERQGEEAFARQAFKDEMANELGRLKSEAFR